MNRLRKAVRDYLTMRRGLGFGLVRHESGLQEFVSFLERKRSPHITATWGKTPICWELSGSPIRRFRPTQAPALPPIFSFSASAKPRPDRQGTRGKTYARLKPKTAPLT